MNRNSGNTRWLDTRRVCSIEFVSSKRGAWVTLRVINICTLRNSFEYVEHEKAIMSNYDAPATEWLYLLLHNMVRRPLRIIGTAWLGVLIAEAFPAAYTGCPKDISNGAE